MLDAAYEAAKGKGKIGSTLKGIGPTYTDKAARLGLRIGDTLMGDFREKYRRLKENHILLLKAYNFDYANHELDGLKLEDYEEKWFDAIKKMSVIKVIDSEYFINQSLDNNKSLLAEGAQGTMLDIDFGTYPFVTSSNTVTAGVCTGLGIAPHRIGDVFGIFKAYCTRVGSGPFHTEQDNDYGQKLRDEGGEYGSTTGRPRRCGWLDMVALKYSIMLNGVTKLFMTKADVLNSFEQIMVGTKYQLQNEVLDYVPFEASYEKMEPVLKSFPGWQSNINNVREAKGIPAELNNYIQYIEKETGVPVEIVSVGPDRSEIIFR